MPLSAEHAAIMAEVQDAYQQAQNAPLRHDKCFSWQQMQVGHALSRAYAAGVLAGKADMVGAQHAYFLKRAAEPRDQ